MQMTPTGHIIITGDQTQLLVAVGQEMPLAQPVAAAQESSVHGLLSSQEMVVNTHPEAALQVSVVQRLLSLHVTGA